MTIGTQIRTNIPKSNLVAGLLIVLTLIVLGERREYMLS